MADANAGNRYGVQTAMHTSLQMRGARYSFRSVVVVVVVVVPGPVAGSSSRVKQKLLVLRFLRARNFDNGDKNTPHVLLCTP